MFRCLLWAIAAALSPKVLLIADNLCLRQQLSVLQAPGATARPQGYVRRFWVLACRWFVDGRTSLLIVKPETAALAPSRVADLLAPAAEGSRAVTRLRPELRTLISRVAIENRLI
jgi:hypothetical protein